MITNKMDDLILINNQLNSINNQDNRDNHKINIDR